MTTTINSKSNMSSQLIQFLITSNSTLTVVQLQGMDKKKTGPKPTVMMRCMNCGKVLRGGREVRKHSGVECKPGEKK